MPHGESGSAFRIVPSREFGLQHFRYQEPQFFPERRLPEYALVCCFAGCINVLEDGRSITLKAGDMMVGHPGLLRASTYLPQEGSCEGATAIVGTKVMERALADVRVAPEGQAALLGGTLHEPRLVAQMKAATAAVGAGRPGVDSYIEGYLRQFLVDLLWQWPTSNIRPQRLAPEQLLSRQHFVQAVEYMHQCGKEDFAVDTLCEVVGVSGAHFRRLLHASARQSPLELYNNVLIHRAEQMLRADTGVKQVAYGLGFPSPSQFGKLFRRMTGYSPSEYQERSQAGLACPPAQGNAKPLISASSH
ncbi:MAG: helix-turn-helix domain-containing protein [Acidobacteria bacterium]|nr:helix-turn-helix domain-containing protein [Acidobacteriota bacterium]